MKYKSEFLFSAILLLISVASKGQYVLDYGQEQPEKTQQTSKWTDRLIPSGNIGANFSANNTFVDISPAVLYAFTPKLHAGPGINYLYRDFTYGYVGGPTYKVTSQNYGGRLLGRYTAFKNFFASAEYMVLNVETYKDLSTNETERVLFHNPSVGGGGYLPIGGRSVAVISIMYMFNGDQRLNPYRNYLGIGNWNIQVGINI